MTLNIKRRAQDREQATREALADVFQAATATDPKAEAEAVQIAKQLGVARETLPGDLTSVRQLVREQQTRRFLAEQLTPGAKEWFKDVRGVRLLHDDLGNLQRTFGAFDWFTRNFEAGSTINEGGFLKAKLAFARQNGGALTPAEMNRLREIDEVQRFAETETGFFDEATKIVGQMVLPAVTAVGVGATAAGAASFGGPVSAGAAFSYGTLSTVFAHSAVVEFGHQYDEIYQQLTAAGVSPSEAHEAALITASAYGLGAAAAETLGFGAIGAPVASAGRKIGSKLLGLAEGGLTRPTAKRAAGTFLKETGVGLFGETFTEGAQELMGSVAQNLAGAAVGKDTGPTLEESLLRAGEVMYRTAKGMAIISPLGPAMHYASDLERAKKAQGAQEMFTQLTEAVKDSEAVKRTPDVFAQVVDAQVQGKPELENVYIEAPKLAEGLVKAGISREQLARDLPNVAQQLAQAEKTGDEVVIPMGDFAAKIAPTDLYPAIQKSIRLANGFSIERAEEWMSEQKKNKEEAAKLVAEASTKIVDWNDQAVAVEDRIRGELAKDTRLSPTEVAHFSSLHRNYVEIQAAREGKTPSQWDKENELKFSVTRSEQQTFEQAAPSSPAFKKWFGQSKVVDRKGEPMVVYHGTTRTFDKFDPEQANIENDFGKGAYFTSSIDDVGANYAGEGPDLTGRIERRAEQLEAEGKSPAVAKRQARKELTQHKGATVPVFLSLQNPAVLGGKDETRLTYELVEEEGYENDPREEGTLLTFIEALRRAAREFFDVDLDEAISALMERALDDGGITVREAVTLLKEQEKFGYATDDMGNLASSEIVRRALELTGFDGIVDRTVNQKFGTQRQFGKQMEGVDPDTIHYIAFRPEQIKSINNRGTFDPNNPNVLAQPGKEPAFFSALRRGIETLNAKALRPKAWKEALTGLQTKGIIKEGERFWTGIDDFLDAAPPNDKLTKEQLLEHLDSKGAVTVEGLRYRDLDEEDRPMEPKTETRTVYEVVRLDEPFGEFDNEREAYDALSEAIEGDVEQVMRVVKIEVGPKKESAVHKIQTQIDELPPRMIAAGEQPFLSYEEWLEQIAPGGKFTIESVQNAAERGLLSKANINANLTQEKVDEINAGLAQKNERLLEVLRRAHDLPNAALGHEGYAQRHERHLDAKAKLARLEEELKDAKAQGTEDEIYVVTLDVNSLPRNLRNRYRIEAESTAETEEEANEIRDKLLDDIREDVQENVSENYYVTDREDEVESDPEDVGEPDQFKHFVAGGRNAKAHMQDYGEIAIVVSGVGARYDAPEQHSFGAEKLDANRIAHVRYSVRKGNIDTTKLPEGYSVEQKLGRGVFGVYDAAGNRYGHGDTEEAAIKHFYSLHGKSLGGENVLFIEEIQSDWADEGRNASFGDRDTPQAEAQLTRAQAESEQRRAAENKRVADLVMTRDVQNLTEDEIAEVQRLAKSAAEARKEEQRLKGAVKKGPFVETTDAWAGLAMKQILMFAAKEGFSRIAFITGDQAAAVYSLAKVASTIEWVYRATSAGRGGEKVEAPFRTYKLVNAFDDNGDVVAWMQVDQLGTVLAASDDRFVTQSLRSVIGKEIAAQVLADWGPEGEAHIETPAEAGVAGMRTFYGNPEGFQTDVAGEVVKNQKGKPVPSLVAKLVNEQASKLGATTGTMLVAGTGTVGGNYFVQLPESAVATIREEGFPLFQENRGEFDPATNTIFLNPSRDPGKRPNASTVLHEMSHFWLSTLFRTASLPTSSVQSRKDAQTVLDWFKVKDLTAWGQLTFAEQRQHHEAWAYNAEAHFFGEGKAPSADPDQVRMFRTFGRWVRAVYRHARDVLNRTYKKLFGVDLPGLTPEVRDVFDRMLASEDAIEAAKAERALAPMFAEKPADMPDDEWQRYREEIADADNAAVDEVQKASLQSMRWTTRNEADMARKIQRATNKIRKQIEAQEREKVEAEPVYLAEQQLRYGTTDDNGVSRPFKLNTNDFLASPFGHSEHMRKLGVGPTGMLAQDGLPIDVAAQMLGWNSGNELLGALLDAPPKEEVVQQRANERMLKEHSELLDPEKVKRMIEAAIHEPARQRMIAAELRWLAKVSTPTRMMVRAAREHAHQSTNKKRVSTVRPHEHAQAEVRERRAALQALGEGNREEAMSHKRRELIESQMEREALAVREEIDKAEKLVKKLFKPDIKLSRSRNVDYVAIARWLAATFGLAPGDKSAEAHIKHLQAYNPELFEQLSPVLERAQQWIATAAREGRQLRTWKDLTVDEFRDLHEAMDALWHRSLREHQVEVNGKKQNLDDLAGEVLAEDAKNPPPAPAPIGAAVTKDFIGRGWNRLLQLVTRIEHWAFRKDGGKVGVFTRYFWRPVRDAVNRYVALRNRYTKRIADKVKELRPKLKQGTIEFRDINGKLLYVFGRGNGGLGHAELIATLLHIGNRGNLERLLTGRQWGTYDSKTDALDTRNWNAFFERMVKEGYVTKDVMDFVQWVWDLNEEVKPLAQKAHRDTLGFYFKEVEATPVQVQFNDGSKAVYRGGYMPAKLDHNARSASRIQSLAELEKDFRKQFATTGRSFTRERADHNAEPLLLDLDLVPSHIDDVLRFSVLQPVIRDVERLAQHPQVFAALEGRQPGVWQNMLLPWLQRVASQSITKAGKSPDIDTFWRYVRSSSGMALMFANLANALQQLTGVITAALKVKPRYLFAGAWRLLTERRALYHDIAEQSQFMANRQKNQVFDSLEQINTLITNKSKFAKARAWAKQHAYFLQTAFQNAVDSVVWSGAYEQALEASKKTMTDADAKAEAIKQADAAVRMTQSSFEPTDVAGYEEGTPFYRMFTMFSGYFNTLANLQGDQLTRMAQATGFAKAGVAFQMYLLGFAVPMLLAEAVVRTVRRQWDDEDDNGDVDVLTFDYLFLSQLRSFIAEIPVAGPSVLAPMLNAFDNKPWNDRMTTSPAITTLERAYGGSVGAVKTALGLKKDRKGNVKDVGGEEIRDVLTLLGVVFGLPLGAVGTRAGYVYDAAQPSQETAGALEVTRGLLTGAPGRDRSR